MKTTLILTLGALIALPVTGIAEEADPAPFAWSRQTLDLIASGDAARGEEIAEKQKCSKCHGDTGVAEDDESPSIAGQVPAYHFKQLLDFRTEVRENKDMKKAAGKLSLQDMADLAAYFATQAPEAPRGAPEAPVLATNGDLGRLLLPCGTCHGRKGEGLGFEVPAIAGQKIDHFIETMNAFKNGDRGNDHFGRMRFIAGQLTDEEITQLAAYYAAPPTAKDEE